MSKHKQFVASLLALAFLCCAGIFPRVGGMGAAQLSGTRSLRPAQQGASLAPNGGERETASASGSLSPTSNDGATGSSVLRPEGSVQTGPVVGGSLVPDGVRREYLDASERLEAR